MCEAAKSSRDDRRARMSVGEIVPSSRMENAYIDVSLMANRIMTNTQRTMQSKLLIGALELKNVTSEEDFPQAVHQTVCYMVSALAYSRWGVLQDKAPLVALLVASNCVYRFTLTRPKSRAMGFMMAIDKAKDAAAMEWLLSDYIQRYVSDCRKISSLTFDSRTHVDTFDWAPLNFGSSKWSPLSESHTFGFLFKTTSDEVIRVGEDYELEWDMGAISPGADVVVKHVNALMDIDFESGSASIASILSESEKAQIKAEYAYLKAKLEGGNPPPPKLKTDSSPPFAPVYDENLLGIKHPYLAIARCSVGPLTVMKDVGAPLSEVMESTQFRQRWAQCASLRDAFFSDVGLSALNLVDKLGLCHNDIRPPNIAFNDSRFCLVDFDFSFEKVRCNDLSAFSTSSRGMLSLDKKPEMMCYSVAQIVLTVFMLSGPTGFELGAVTDAISIWKSERGTSEVDAEFEGWVQGKGCLLLDFVSACRGASPWPAALAADCKKYFSDVLSEMLK